jgi:hypothetical protein
MNKLTTLGLLLCVSACAPAIPVVQPIVDAGPNPCEGQTCGGQGTCAVVNGAAAVCVCNGGFFAEGLECKAIVAGAECEGVTCSGRGACVVLSGMPNTPRCDCNADSVSAGATTCVAKPTPCAGVTCSGHGSCAVAGTMPVCVCEAGFRTGAGNTCEPVIVGQECQGIDCSGHGTCAVAGGAPLCSCDVGYDRLGTTCVPRPVPDGGGAGPCAGVTCSGRGQCAVTGGTTPVCVCNSGYVANSLACVLQGTVGGALTLLAGALGGPGYVDGNVNTRFDSPAGVAHDANGNLYVGGQTIRKITPSGSVSTLAGLAGLVNAGSVDGIGSAARFTSAQHPVVDSAGNLLVLDVDASGSGSIRKLTPGGVVSTLSRGLLSVVGMTIDANDNLWASGFCASGNSNPCLRKVTPGGVVTSRTLTMAPGVPLVRIWPGPFALSADGNTVFMTTTFGAGFAQNRGADVVTIDANTGLITRLLGIAPPGSNWTSTELSGLCRDGSNNLWLVDTVWGRIWRVPSTGGTATLIAGDASFGGAPPVSLIYNAEPLNIDGPGASARFFRPAGLSCDQTSGKVYVGDRGNHTIRAVAMAGTNLVTTIGGTPIAQGAVDGTGGAARFRFPQQLVADSAGNWFVADSGNAVIRKITPAGVVSVFVGSSGMPGLTDGTGTAARFRGTECVSVYGCHVIGLAVDSSDNLYVADRGRRLNFSNMREPDAIRKITPAGVVTTLASGNMVTPSSSNNTGDQFDSIAVDSTNGDVYFNAKDGVRRLRSGAITLVVPTLQNVSVAVDSTRRKLFVSAVPPMSGPPEVSRYDMSGATPFLESTLTSANAPALGSVGIGAGLGQLAVAPNGALAATFAASHVILRIDPTFTRVDKIAGEYGARGVELGPLPAQLNTPTGVAFNAAGQFGIVMGRADTSIGTPTSGEGTLLVTTGFTP